MKFYPWLRALLFRLPPERAHRLALGALAALGRIPPGLFLLEEACRAPARPVEAFGLRFPNPLGLAAGYDKEGVALKGLAALGFGHLEIGSVTPRPQEGNPPPRLFRLPESGALVNRMGFPSAGAAALARRLARGGKPRRALIGVNLGKNRETPNEEAVLDYLELVRIFAPLADYLAVNVSSPNTVGLRALQERAALESLLSQLDARRRLERSRLKKPLPLLVKLSPDLSPAALEAALEAILRSGMDGVILTNTTTARPGLEGPLAAERGGLSGAPLRSLSEMALQRALRLLEGALPVVSVGGVITPEDVRRRLEMGAALVQVYTGLVYYGPALVRDSLKRLASAAGR